MCVNWIFHSAYICVRDFMRIFVPHTDNSIEAASKERIGFKENDMNIPNQEETARIPWMNNEDEEYKINRGIQWAI